MLTRRRFLKTASLAGGATLLTFRKGWGWTGAGYFGLNEFVESHPDAVFVFRTAVDAKTNTAAINDAAFQLCKTLFVVKPDGPNAYPLTANVALKPNITSWDWDKTPVDQTMGIQTDPWFVEGLIRSLTDLTIPSGNIFIREANYTALHADGKWYSDLASRTGVKLKEFSTLAQLSPSDVQWADVPSGVWYSRIPYFWPVNSAGSFLLNISKFKSHSMGMTLCSKNLQGTNVRPYVAHCSAWGSNMSGVDAANVRPNAFANIKTDYDRHKSSIPRWKTLDGDTGGASAGGLWMETHTARCLDNNSVLQPALNIIEGVYGREGPFVSGPGPGGYGIDVMANLVIFGKNARHVDIIGTYLAGHEPGNFGLFHIARERGLSKYLDPGSVPLFEWSLTGTASPATLASFPRVPIRTLYLRQAGEEAYHMVDQPFDYAAVSVDDSDLKKPHVPDAFVIRQNFPNPFNPTTSIQYYLPRGGGVRLEILDVQGEVVDVLAEGMMPAGDHLAVWRADRRASGTYFYRLLFEGTSQTRRMVLIR